MKYQHYLKQFTDQKVLIIGEMVLDVFLQGTSTRICREAPVPIVDVSEKTEVPGGASNTAENVAALGAQASFVSVCGDDFEGNKIISQLNNQQIETTGVFKDPQRNTLTKKRIVSDEQLLLRYDYGSTHAIDTNYEEKIIAYLEDNFSKYDAIIASDYGYGIFTDNILKALATLQKKHNTVFVVDSKNLALFKDIAITAVKPNYSQATALLKLKKLHQRRVNQILKEGSAIFNIINTKIAAITVDMGGSVIFEQGKKPFKTATKPMPNSHASGAGDTFVSALTLSLAVGAPTEIAAQIASKAAEIVVKLNGTSICSLDELKEAFVEKNKIMRSLSELEQVVNVYKSENKKIVFTNGCFDILNKNHMAFLKEAKQQGDILIVGLNSDKSVKTITGKKPFNSETDRIEILKELSTIDHIYKFDGKTPIKILQRIKPDVFVKGGNYRDKSIPEAEVIEGYKGNIKILDFYSDDTNVFSKMHQTFYGMINSFLL